MVEVTLLQSSTQKIPIHSVCWQYCICILSSDILHVLTWIPNRPICLVMPTTLLVEDRLVQKDQIVDSKAPQTPSIGFLQVLATMY